jgi:hypothetical protein
MIEAKEILVFTRMPADGFDVFMSNPEAVIATVEDMGFDQDALMKSMSASGDPVQLVQLMEGRWSGEEMNFSFENFWSALFEKFPHNYVLKLIMEEGRNSQIYTDFAEIRVLSPAQVLRAHDGLLGMDLENLNSDDETDLMLEDLFPALKKFFSYASAACEFVLVSRI